MPMLMASFLGLVVLIFMRRRMVMRRHLAAVAAIDQFPGAHLWNEEGGAGQGWAGSLPAGRHVRIIICPPVHLRYLRWTGGGG